MRRTRRCLAALGAACLVAACQGTDRTADTPTPARDAAEPAAAGTPGWVEPLTAEIERIDADMPGDFGVLVRRLGEDGGEIDHGDGRAWYLSSTIKIPVAIAVLERVDAGELDLDQELVLAESDFVDGAGDMLYQEPGTRFSIGTLIEKSLRDSDSTATDMLIRLVGEDHLNRRIRAWAGRGFGPVTTLLQVRYDAYGPLHPGVAALSNTQIVALRNAEAGEARLAALARALGVPRGELDAPDLETVFERYYETGRNAATLDAFADMLETLATGELLSEESTALVLDHMQAITTGDRRIQAGLPSGADFAQKTGTQIARACNVGVLGPGSGAPTVVVACAERFDDLEQAERAFARLGRALAEAGLADGR
ncbi:serine hydrolase [Coralloluteibacterium thermophilus]|uniref:Serine hydrolase n=1 Tax=Coralloluteibacterium thermophilum TaxID=2707049 RepID=A0ABV9NK89_9GAMM